MKHGLRLAHGKRAETTTFLVFFGLVKRPPWIDSLGTPHLAMVATKDT